MSYNGCSNRETWLVQLWFNPRNKDDVESARELLEQQYDEIPDGVIKDMIDLCAINWDELLNQFPDEDDDEDDDEDENED